MVAQAPRRSHDDLRAIGQRAALLAHVHAADAGDGSGSGWLIKPFEFAPDLQRQFARRRHGHRQGIGPSWNPLAARQQFRRHRKAESHGLAGACLRRNQEIGARRLRREDRGLDGRQFGVAMLGKGSGQHRGDTFKNGHSRNFQLKRWQAPRQRLMLAAWRLVPGAELRQYKLDWPSV